jgi:hypothetical protein
MYLIISVKHTKKDDPYILLWNPENKGYCYRQKVAGRYSEAELNEHPNYYNNGHSTLAVDETVLSELWEQSELGWLDSDGLVLKNIPENWDAINQGRYQIAES